MTTPEREWVRGVSTPLPPGERIRWQGAPDERALARHVFHIRKIAVYFGLLLLWRAALAGGAVEPLTYFLAGAAPLTLLGAVALGCSRLLARLAARSTVYALTDRRIVMRTGIVLSATINLPFRQIVGASLKAYGDGTGDLALRLGGEDRLAYLMLWPHARAWHVSQPQPTLRCLPDAEEVGALLRDGLTASLAAGGEPAPSLPVPAPVAATPLAKPATAPLSRAVGIPA